MNKTVLIALGVGAILIAILAGVLLMGNKTSTPQTSDTSNSQTAETGSALQSLKDLFSSGKSQECTFTDTAGNGGTVYVQGGKMRGDFTTVSPQGSTNAHMIVDGTTSYIWMDGQPSGFKMTFDINAATEAQTTANNQNVDLDKKVDYSCKGWTVNPSLFTLPAGVTFTDFGNLTVPAPTEAGASGTPSTNTKAQQCAACDSAPEAYKAQCKAALGCN